MQYCSCGVPMSEVQKQYEFLLQNMAQGVFFHECSGALIDVNPAALEMFGLTRDQFLGRTSLHPDWRVVKEDGTDLPPAQHPSMVALSTGENVDNFVAGVYNPLSKSFVWLNINATPMFRDGEEKPYQTFVTLHDISEQIKTKNIYQSRLNLLELSQTHTPEELLVCTLDEVEKLTNSTIGFYHFYDADTQKITLNAWPTGTSTQFCNVVPQEGHYPLQKAGVWADCIRSGRPVVHNDYPSLSHRKGLPEGHAHIVRELVVPVKRNGKVVAILGVGNKPVDYTEADVNTVTLFADMAWDIAQRKLSERHFQRTEQILSSSTDMIALLNRQYIYVWANKAYLESFGLISEQLIGQSVAAVFGDEIFNTVIKPAADCCLKGENINYQEWFDFPATGQCYMDINYTPYFNEDNQIMGFIVNARNITKSHQTEDTLSEYHEKLYAALESMEDAVFISDSQGDLVHLNNAFATFHRFKNKAECTNRLAEYPQILEAFLPNGEPLPLDQWAVSRALRGETATNFECTVRRKDTGETWIGSSNFGPFFDQQGNIAGAVVVARDITESKKIQDQLRVNEELLRVALKGAPLVLFNQDTSLRYTWIHNPNPGFKESQIIGRTDAELLPEQEAVALKAIKQQVLESGRGVRQNMSTTIKNKTFVYDLTIEPLLNDAGAIVGITCASLDITELKQAEETLKQKNQELEQFVYSVSHDLKSPLITVKTYAGMLRQDLLNDDQQQINKGLDYIDKAADKMEQLLGALLHYSRIGRNDAPAQTLPARQSVENCLTTLAGILQQHQIQVLSNELTQQLRGDSLHFEQIWQNLIENAVKYSGDQAHPQIEIGAIQHAPDDVFYVRDNGIGIAPKHRDRIFNLFSQLNPGSEGSGLGLALVKKIVSIYQGRVWVESAGDGKGSCFMFTLPTAVINNDTTP